MGTLSIANIHASWKEPPFTSGTIINVYMVWLCGTKNHSSSSTIRLLTGLACQFLHPLQIVNTNFLYGLGGRNDSYQKRSVPVVLEIQNMSSCLHRGHREQDYHEIPAVLKVYTHICMKLEIKLHLCWILRGDEEFGWWIKQLDLVFHSLDTPISCYSYNK